MELQNFAAIVGMVTMIINVGIAIFNVGKNRIVYDVEEVHVDRTKGDLQKLKNRLNNAEYTVLNVFQDNDRKIALYTIGKVKEANKKFIAREGLIAMLFVAIGYMFYAKNYYNLNILAPAGYALYLTLPIYVFYWVIRFVVWAIKNLRTEHISK